MKSTRKIIRQYPGMRLSKSLEKYRGVSLFPEKVAKANETLARIGLPKEFYEDKSK